MIRKRLGFITASVIIVPLIVLLLISNPDLSEEKVLIENVGFLKDKLEHAEMQNRERLTDVALLSRKLNIILQSDNLSSYLSLSSKEKTFLQNTSLTTDLHLPSVYSFMPHLLRSQNSTTPAFKLSKGRSGVDVVMGVPTVKREVQSYLMTTLRSLIDSMHPKDLQRCLFVVFVGESDLDYVNRVASLVEKKFPEHVESGLIEVISPSPSYYPNMDSLKITLGDPVERVRWRTKQNLDYAFLMMYAQPKGVYYVQLEDDIQAKPGFFETMVSFARRKTAEKKEWIVLDFCQLGFIGKLFKTVDLPEFVSFTIIFRNDQPGDWLLSHFVSNKVCGIGFTWKICKKAKEAVWIRCRPSVFQHIGTHSSLKGKVQKLKDKLYGKVQLHFPHHNPPAKLLTTIKVYKTFTLEKAYRGESYFWGLLPQDGDVILFEFTPPLPLKEYLIRSGNVEHPSDRLYNTTVEILPAKPLNSDVLKSFKRTNDNFIVLGTFDDMGVAERKIGSTFGNISTLRLSIHSESENWAIISEICFVPLDKSR
ncbi:UNVERIFIED_CONTAM: hypothetical protein RMT77_000480 [Armadillidium vulgare]